jgi:hypothetical protein
MILGIKECKMENKDQYNEEGLKFDETLPPELIVRKNKYVLKKQRDEKII